MLHRSKLWVLHCTGCGQIATTTTKQCTMCRLTWKWFVSRQPGYLFLYNWNTKYVVCWIKSRTCVFTLQCKIKYKSLPLSASPAGIKKKGQRVICAHKHAKTIALLGLDLKHSICTKVSHVSRGTMTFILYIYSLKQLDKVVNKDKLLMRLICCSIDLKNVSVHWHCNYICTVWSFLYTVARFTCTTILILLLIDPAQIVFRIF